MVQAQFRLYFRLYFKSRTRTIKIHQHIKRVEFKKLQIKNSSLSKSVELIHLFTARTLQLTSNFPSKQIDEKIKSTRGKLFHLNFNFIWFANVYFKSANRAFYISTNARKKSAAIASILKSFSSAKLLVEQKRFCE